MSWSLRALCGCRSAILSFIREPNWSPENQISHREHNPQLRLPLKRHVPLGKAATEMTAHIPVSFTTGLLPTKFKGYVNLALLQSQPLLTPHQRLVTCSTSRSGRGWYIICMVDGHLPPMLPSNIPSPTLLLWALGCQCTMKPFFLPSGTLILDTLSHIIAKPMSQFWQFAGHKLLNSILILRCLLWVGAIA